MSECWYCGDAAPETCPRCLEADAAKTKWSAEIDRMSRIIAGHNAELVYLRQVAQAARELLRHHLGPDKGWYVSTRRYNGGGFSVDMVIDGLYTHRSDAEAVRDVVWQPALDSLVALLERRATTEDSDGV